MKELTDSTLKQAIEQSKQENKIAVVDFYASWCGPCQLMKPILEDVDKSGEINLIANIYKIDVDENVDCSSEYKIKSIPTIILFNGNEVLSTLIGMSTKEKLINLIKEKKIN